MNRFCFSLRQLTSTVLLFAGMTTVAGRTSQAITINMIPAPNNQTVHPGYDPNLVKLTQTMQAAADYWEHIFPQNHQIDITFGYLDLAPAILGVAEVQGVNAVTGRPTAGAIALDSTVNSQTLGDIDRDWYFDPTPLANNEFAMQQVLVRDLTPQQRAMYYNGNPPGLLEAGYWGNYSGADLGDDAFTVALHEVGHILGVTNTLPDSAAELADGDYDFPAGWINGATAAAEYWDLPGDNQPEHLRSPDALMSVGAGSGDRHLPGATDIFAAAAVGNWTSVDLYRMDYLDGTVWDLGINWEGGTRPDNDDDVYVRHGGDVSILLDSVAGKLTIRDGSGVETNDNTLTVSDRLTVEAGPNGSDAAFSAEPGGRVNADAIRINDGGRFVVSGSTVSSRAVTDLFDINPGGLLLGHGRISFDHFHNNGTITVINPFSDNATALRLVALGGGTIDLDGVNSIAPFDTGGGIDSNGQVFVVLGNLDIDGPLSDPFDGEMTVGATRNVNFSDPWQFGDGIAISTGQLNLDGGDTQGDAAAINGARMTAYRGEIHVTGFGQINANVDFEEAIEVDVATGGILELNGTSTFDGGSYTGGGTIRFNGDATIEGPTTLNVMYADLDGAGGGADELSISGGRLTVIADKIDGPAAANRFDGTMNINGLHSRLDVQLNNANASWQMDGVLNLNGSPLPGVQLDGSDIRVTGTMNVDGISWVSANLDVEGAIVMADASTKLGLLTGTHVIRDTASVTGPGTLDIRHQTQLNLDDNAIVAVDVENRGRLEPGMSVGQATIDGDYDQFGVGTLAVELAGDAFGVDYDLLDVTGTATLDGTLEIALIDGFIPDVGEILTILTGGSVTGSFSDVATLTDSFYDFDVSVGYQPTRAFVRFLGLFIPGDFDDDGDVDGADFLAWQENFGTPSGATTAMGDADGDGDVDGQDFLVWQGNLGETLPMPGRGGGAASASVPEPASLAFCLVLVIVGIAHRRCG